MRTKEQNKVLLARTQKIQRSLVKYKDLVDDEDIKKQLEFFLNNPEILENNSRVFLRETVIDHELAVSAVDYDNKYSDFLVATRGFLDLPSYFKAGCIDRNPRDHEESFKKWSKYVFSLDDESSSIALQHTHKLNALRYFHTHRNKYKSYNISKEKQLYIDTLFDTFSALYENVFYYFYEGEVGSLGFIKTLSKEWNINPEFITISVEHRYLLLAFCICIYQEILRACKDTEVLDEFRYKGEISYNLFEDYRVWRYLLNFHPTLSKNFGEVND